MTPGNAGELCARAPGLVEYTAARSCSELPLWPGCSVTAAIMARQVRVKAVRPGSYVFGDMSLAESTGVIPLANTALTVMATVIDRPEPGSPSSAARLEGLQQRQKCRRSHGALCGGFPTSASCHGTVRSMASSPAPAWMTL